MTHFAILLVTILGTVTMGIRINCGGRSIPPHIVGDSKNFSKTSTGAVHHFGRNVKTTTVYPSHAFASGGKDLVYTIPIIHEGKPGSPVVVVAAFSERWRGAAHRGARVMQLLINGRLIVDHLDVWLDAGGLNKPFDVTEVATVRADGTIEVRVRAVQQNAMISGISVDKPSDASLDMTPELAEEEEEKKAIEDMLMQLERKPLKEKDVSSKKAVISNGPRLVGSGSWRTVKLESGVVPWTRHEACALMVNGKVYMIGGRGFRSVSVFDPRSRTWVNKKMPPVEMNHMQCVSIGTKVYVAGAWSGKYPFEVPLNDTWVYETTTDSWDTLPGLPERRRRGSGALVVHQGILYLAMGNQGGHGKHSKSVGYLDFFDPKKPGCGWNQLATAPDARDHVMGGVVGGYLCVAGGRDGGKANFWDTPVRRVNCYNFKTDVWERRAKLPQPRAGSAVGATCQGLLIVAGGEGHPGGIHDRVDYYNVTSDSFLPPGKLRQARHGSQLAIADCECGNIYLPSGSGRLGGGPDLESTEVWSPDGEVRHC